jgi:hypothetical protein
LSSAANKIGRKKLLVPDFHKKCFHTLVLWLFCEDGSVDYGADEKADQVFSSKDKQAITHVIDSLVRDGKAKRTALHMCNKMEEHHGNRGNKK